VQAAEENPVRVEHVDQPGEPEPEALGDQAGRGPHRGVSRVLVPQQGGGLLEHGSAGTGYPAGRRHQAERVGLHVQAAPAAAAARASARVHADVPGFHPEAGTAGVQDAVEHERPANALVAGGHHQQVPGVAARAVPVLGQRGQVDVVGRRRCRPVRAGQAGSHGLRGEDVPDPDAGWPADVQRADGDALRLGHGGRHRQGGPDADPARRPQQPGAGPPSAATTRPPRPTSATAKPSGCTWAAKATGPSGSIVSRCEGRPRVPPPGAVSTRISRSACSSAATAPAVARVTPSRAPSAARVGARPPWMSARAGPSCERPREALVPFAVVRS